MTVSLTTIVALLVVLQIKHFICDYPLQTRYQLVNKGTYWHPGGILHSGIHAVATTSVFLIVTPPLLIGLAIVVGEFLIHYHLDWAKSKIMNMTHWRSDQAPFWWAIGADQLFHHLTYLAIAVILVTTAAS